MSRFLNWEPFGLDLRSLAVFRVGLALTILLDLRGRSSSIEEHYTDAGVLPRYALNDIPTPQGLAPTRGLLLSFHRLTGTMRGQQILFLLHHLVSFALLAGVWTRLATIGSWLMLLSLQRRNPLVLQGDDYIRRCLLFWGMFLPLGARYSVDRALSRSKTPLPPRAHSWGAVGYILQIALIYWINGLAKKDPVWRKERSAVYYVLRLDSYATRFGRSMLRYPRLLKHLTFATVWFELLAPCLLFVPHFVSSVRLFLFTSFAFFHSALGRSLVLGLFTKTCIVAWTPLLPGVLWDWLGALTTRRAADRHPIARWNKRRINTGSHPVCEQASGLELSNLAGALAILGLVTITLSNLRWLYRERLDSGRLAPFDRFCALVGLNQYWNLFAPRPARNDGWFVISGVLENGEVIDLLRDGAPLDWQKPENPAYVYPDVRWRNWHTNLWARRAGYIRPVYIQYLQRRWNRQRQAGQRLKAIRMYYMVQEVLADFEVATPIKVLLWDHERLTPRPPTNVGADLPAAYLRYQLENGEFPAEALAHLQENGEPPGPV